MKWILISLAGMALITLVVWSFFFYTKQTLPANENKVEVDLRAAANTFNHSYKEIKLSVSTTTPVVATTTVVTQKVEPAQVKQPAQQTPKAPQGPLFTRASSTLSLRLPSGWSSIIDEDATTTSTWKATIGPSNQINLDDPEPLILLIDSNFTKTSALDYEEMKAIADFVTEYGADTYMNTVIDEVLKKQYNLFELVSVAKRNINGIEFYEIVSNYVSENTGKDITLIMFTHVTNERDITLSIFSENWPLIKNTVLGMVSTLRI